MSARTVYCPKCDEPIAVDRSAAEDKRIRCPACDKSFPLSGRNTARSRAADDDFDDEGETRRRRPKKRGWSTATKVILGLLIGGGLLLLIVCGGIGYGIWWMVSPTSFPEQTEDYAEARQKFKTKLVDRGPAPQDWDPEVPLPGVREITYTSGGLQLKAWVNDAPRRGGKQPAVLFLHGGFAFGSEDWDMTRPYRDAGFVVMTPMVRGENGLPGSYTMFYDEVDDVIAAGNALAELPYVDASRIYIAGHSAGGTLTLLAAMTSKRFRAAAAFSGSPDQVAFSRGQEELVPFDTSDPREYQMRSPLAYPKSFKCPVRIYYGSSEFFFKSPSQKTAERAKAAGLDVEAVSVPGDHFTSVAPAMQQSIVFFQQK
jgi:dienelactone hydrolase